MPEDIEVTGNRAVAQGKTVTLKAYAFYTENGKEIKTKDTIKWKSLDENVATVSGGKVKGISAGDTIIEAYISIGDGEEIVKEFPVSVVVPAKSLEFEMSKLDVFVGDEIIAKWTGNGAPYYYFEFVDSDGNYASSGGTNGDECQSFNLALWLPRTNEDCTYSFVLYAEDENYNMTEIARLDNCLEITVSGDALGYDMVFNDGESGKHSVTLETIPQGIKLLSAWYDEQGLKRSSGTSSINRNKTEHQAIQNGYSYDLRVLKEHKLDGQKIRATITPESKKTYINENEAKIKWNVDGIITWQAPENVDNYKLNIYSGEGVDADNFITYRNLGKYYTEYFVDANLNIAELAGNEDGILTVELVAYDSSYRLIEVVGTLTIDVSFTEEIPVFDIEVLDERNYIITFAEGTPDGMRYMQWYDADGNLSGGKSGFGDTSLSETEMKDYEFADGDKLEVYIATVNSSTDTVWTIERTSIATWTYTAE